MIGPITTTAVTIRRISGLAMSTMVIRTPTEAVIIQDTAAHAPIGPQSPCAELGWTLGDASTIRAVLGRCRTVFDDKGEHPSRWAAISSIAAKIRRRRSATVKKADDRQQPRALAFRPMSPSGWRPWSRENRELRQTNEILRIFAQGGARHSSHVRLTHISR